MTVEELGDRMSADEFDEWAVFLELRHEAEQKAMNDAKKGR
jgi:hypothetical protein